MDENAPGVGLLGCRHALRTRNAWAQGRGRSTGTKQRVSLQTRTGALGTRQQGLEAVGATAARKELPIRLQSTLSLARGRGNQSHRNMRVTRGGEREARARAAGDGRAGKAGAPRPTRPAAGSSLVEHVDRSSVPWTGRPAPGGSRGAGGLRDERNQPECGLFCKRTVVSHLLQTSFETVCNSWGHLRCRAGGLNTV